FGRFGYNRLPAWFRTRAGTHADPLAVQRGALANSQTLLTMGDDGARGSLHFKLEDGEPSDGGRLLLSWPQTGASTLAHEIDSLLAEHDREAGLDGGQYVSNPLWRLLPESARSVMVNTFTAGRRLTVHPLGGCRMADSGEEGVVDHRGRVFN